MEKAAVLLFLISTCLHAQGPPAPSASATPAKLSDQRATPRSAFFGYLEACRAGDFRRAASFLNLEHSRYRSADAQDLARQLKEVLDRRLTGDPGRLSNSPDGDLTDGLDPDYELLGTVKSADKDLDLLLERVSRDENQIWLVSASTVHLIPVLHQALGATWAQQHLPAWMLAAGPLDTDVWQWLALLLLMLASFGVAALLARLIVRVLTVVLRRTHGQPDDELVASFVAPVQFLLTVALFHSGLAPIGPPVLLRAYLMRLLTALAYLATAWLAVRIIDLVSDQLVKRMAGDQRASARSVVPLGRRTAKVAALTIAVLATLTTWGYNTTAILAGLGVGGLAVALAAQKTIENLFGGVALTTDRPVLVGDFCRYGDKLGTVEDIGLRSTRIRTLDRTVVTIPNAQFSSLPIENFARRDKIFLNPKLNLRRETTLDQLRVLIPALRGVLLNHPQVDPNPARVRFIGIGPWSLDIEIFAYVSMTDFDQFLVVQEELLLGLMTEIEKAGTALAIPAQLNLNAPAPSDVDVPGRIRSGATGGLQTAD